MNRFNTPVLRCLQFGSIALATSALFACGGGGSSPDGTINGTAAIGAPMKNGAITFVCKNGSANTAADANGAFSVKFKFDGPCAITGSSGGITLHSFAPGAGTVNVTPLTGLLLSYLAAQLGTTVDNLLASLSTNSTYQNALSNSSTIANAETAIATILKNTYGITLSSSAFLTTAFTVGQGQDKDLDQLMAAGAIDAYRSASSNIDCGRDGSRHRCGQWIFRRHARRRRHGWHWRHGYRHEVNPDKERPKLLSFCLQYQSGTGALTRPAKVCVPGKRRIRDIDPGYVLSACTAKNQQQTHPTSAGAHEITHRASKAETSRPRFGNASR